MTPTLCHGVALFLCVLTSPAWACSAISVHKQHIVLSQFGTDPMRLPQEITVRANDLISVLAPREAKIKMVDADDRETNTVSALEPERYQALSRHRREKIPAEIREGVYPSHLTWRHFAAAAPGLAYLKLTVEKEHALLRVNISEPPVVQRGTNHVWSDARQGDSIELTPFDTLTLALPGEPGDGWRLEIPARPVALTSISRQEPENAHSPARVLLHMKAAQLLSGRSPYTLTVHRIGRETYQFTVQPRHLPVC